MNDTDPTQLHLDIYMTRDGPWDPDHGDIEIPDDWDFLQSGDAFVTRQVKAAGVFWVAWRPRGRNRPHRRRLGLWAPREAIEAAQAAAASTDEERAKRRADGASARAGAEAAGRAAETGSGRVGRTRTLPIEERAGLAARALIRHRYTSYEDDLVGAAIDDPWDEDLWYGEVKAEAQVAVDDFLNRHRQGSQ